MQNKLTRILEFDSSYEVVNLQPMKQIMFIFILFSFLWSEEKDIDVNHMIVKYKGQTIDCLIDSMGFEYIYYTPKDSVEMDSIKLKDIYYIYNDLNKIFHYSWSFEENVRRMENRTGNIYTTKGDTFNFIDIKFYKDMIQPEVYIKKNVENSAFIPMLEIEKIETDYSIISYASKRGFYYSFSLFFISTLLEINSDWKKGIRLFPAAANQLNDLMPNIQGIGLKDAGATYQSLTSLIPISVFGTMIYDVIRNKNQFYFTPIYKEKAFGRNMYVFSLKHILEIRLHSLVYKVESTKFGGKVVRWIRKRVN